MHVNSLFVYAALTAVSFGASSITELNAKQSQRILSAWSVYSATVAYDSKVASLVGEVYTIVPSSDIASATATTTSSIDLVSYINNPPKVTSPSWISDLPSSVASAYMSLQTSVEDAMVSLAQDAATNTASTAATTIAIIVAQSTGSTTRTAAATTTTTTSTSSTAAAASASSTGAAPTPHSNAGFRFARIAAGAVGAAAWFL